MIKLIHKTQDMAEQQMNTNMKKILHQIQYFIMKRT